MNPVEWLESAYAELADVYVSATVEERERIASAVDALNRRLALDPDAGESRDGANRVVTVLPVTLRFRRTGSGVTVYHVHHVRAR
jgi:plasmid stabilization system protein ParE